MAARSNKTIVTNNMKDCKLHKNKPKSPYYAKKKTKQKKKKAKNLPQNLIFPPKESLIARTSWLGKYVPGDADGSRTTENCSSPAAAVNGVVPGGIVEGVGGVREEADGVGCFLQNIETYP